LRVLTANFRNGLEATRVANQLLKIKHRRFGSIDRESNFLVQAVGGEAGQVALMPDKDATKRELDQKIRQSTQFAVLVMRDEDKAEARRSTSRRRCCSRSTKRRGSSTRTSSSTASSPITAPSSARSSMASPPPTSRSRRSTTGGRRTRATSRSRSTSSSSMPSTWR
jgi:hypothetical protein